MYDEFIHDACACSGPGDATGGWKPRAASPAKIKNRLFLSVIADRIAEVRHVLAESVHRVAAGKTEQKPGERAECEAAQ
jgi:hypothetical protein